MKLVIILALACAASAQQKFKGLLMDGPFINQSGTTLPGSCTDGQQFVKTDDPAQSNLYTCVGSTWTQQSGGIGSVTHTVGALDADLPLLGAGGADIKSVSASTARTALGVTIGTDVQPYDATTQTASQPTYRNATCNATIAAKRLVQVSGLFIVPATGLIGVNGVSMAACIGAGVITVAQFGEHLCSPEGSITANNLVIPGTTDPTKCKDSGTTDINAIPLATPVIGVARQASAGTDFLVSLIGPHRFGAQQTGFRPTPQAVTGGSTTSVVVPFNGTIAISEALPSCVTTGGAGFNPGGYTNTTTNMTITFDPTAQATGTCTAVPVGGGGGGGAGGTGDLSSNTAVSVDGELLLFSGTLGKTAKRANLTGLIKASSGVAAVVVLADVLGLFTGTPTGSKFLRDDGSWQTPSGGGGSPCVAGTGITITGGCTIGVDGSMLRAGITGTASLTFGAITAQTCATGTITVTGALTAEAVSMHLPTTVADMISFDMRVTAADTVTVRACNNKTSASVTPVAGTTYGATVWKTF